MTIYLSPELSKKSLDKPGQEKKKLPKTEKNDAPILYVFRHGETYDNKARIFSGRRDTDLTPQGIKQAEVLAEKLKDKRIDLGICSDLKRAQKTLEIVSKHYPNMKIETEKSLVERDYGELTGTSKTELYGKDPELCAKYRRSWDFPPPGGESLQMVYENRVKSFCIGLEGRMRDEMINVAVSCTNNTMRLIRMFFEDLEIMEMLKLENPLARDYASYKISQT